MPELGPFKDPLLGPIDAVRKSFLAGSWQYPVSSPQAQGIPASSSSVGAAAALRGRESYLNCQPSSPGSAGRGSQEGPETPHSFESIDLSSSPVKSLPNRIPSPDPLRNQRTNPGELLSHISVVKLVLLSFQSPRCLPATRLWGFVFDLLNATCALLLLTACAAQG